MAGLAAGRNPQARAGGDVQQRQFRADPLPRPPRPHCGGRRRLPHAARPDPAPRQSLQASERAAHDRRQRGGEPPRGRRAGGVRGPQMKGQPIFNRLALIGMGLIGSSIARAARAQGAARSIVATARSAATRRRLAELGLADYVVETNAAAAEGADLVIVAIPVGACGAVAAEIGPHLAPGAIVSDVGSVKNAVLRAMSPQHHDLVLGITSHLPHLIAYTIVGTADELSQVTRSEVLQFSAGGFRDFTRIAASDPTMWRDVFLANKDAVLEMLGRFNEDVSALTKAIRKGDGDALFEHFERTRVIRKGIVEIGQDSPSPDFGRPHPDLPHEPM